MRRMLFLVVLWLAATASFAGTRIIPVAGHLPGANNTAWTTDVTLNNNTAAATTVDLVFRPEDGVARTRTIVLEAHQSMLLEDAVAPSRFSGSNPSSWMGQLEIRSASDVTASAHIFTSATNGGTFGSTYDDFDPRVLSTAGSMSGLVSSVRYRTNVAFVNPNDVAAAFTYTLRAENGVSLVTRRVDVPAHSTRQVSLGGDLPTTTDDSRLSLTWTANVPGYAIGSVIDNKSGDPTNAPSIAGGSTSLFFPVVGKTPGANNTQWATSVALTNTTDAAGSVTFVYRDAGNGATFAKTATIAARGTFRSDDVNAFVGATSGSGSLTVDATMPVVGAVRLFNTQTDGSTYGSAVLPQENIVRSTRVRIDGVRRDDDYRLNVGISNDDATSAATGKVRLFDDRGVEVEVEPFHVEHGRAVQVAMNRGDHRVHAGEIEVESENGISIVVVASNIDNRTGDTLHHEAEQENERQNDREIRMSARTAAAGTPVTFSLGNTTGVASVSWSFGDGASANGFTATHTYASAGEFDVTATITLTNGATIRDREDIHITGSGTSTPSGPIDFTFSPGNPAPGQEVVFTASGATNGGFFKWEFPGNVVKTGSVVTFTFATAGSFEVELELEHGGADTIHVEKIVNVGGGTNTNPGAIPTSVDFTWSPSTIRAGQTVTFTATTDKPLPSGWTVKWRLPNDSRPEGNSVSYTFATAGTYRVRAELEPPNGDSTVEREKTVTVTQ